MEREPVIFPSFSSRLFIAVFLVLIFGPFLFFFVDARQEIAQSEKRVKAPFPDFALQKVLNATYQKELDYFLNDRFGFRDSLVTWNAYAHIKFLRTSPVSTVVVGNGNWLYYAGENALGDYLSEKLFTEQELETIGTTIRKVTQAFEKNRKTFVLMMVPEKHTLYPEHLPSSHRQRNQTRFQQLSLYLQKQDLPFLDVTPALEQAKKDRQIYHQTDTHWNDYGSYVGYYELMAFLGKTHSDIIPRAIEDFSFETRKKSNGDLAYMLSLSGTLLEMEEYMKRTTPSRTRVVKESEPLPYTEVLIRENPQGKHRMVFFRDSFGAALMSNLSDYFSRSLFVRSNNILPDVIAKENPDIVVLEMVERYEETLLDLSADGLDQF